MRTSALLSAICLAALSACAQSGDRKQPAPSPTPRSFAFVTATIGSLTPERRVSGFIAPRRTITLTSTVNEPAAEVFVDEGDHVERGQRLAVFDTSDLAANLRALEASATQAEANTTRQGFQSEQTIGQGVGNAGQARANVRQAQEKLGLDVQTLNRDLSLQTQGYLAAQTVDQQRTAVANDRAAVRSAQAALDAADITVRTNGSTQNGLQGATIAAQRAAAASSRAQADQLRAQIGRATLAAPLDGVVLNRNINPGEYPGTRTLFTLAASGNVDAVLNASAEQVQGIRVGQAATIALQSERNRTHRAHVEAVLGQTDPGSTNFTVKLLLEQKDADLLGGMPLTARITLDPLRGVRIPRSAFTDGTESSVVTVRDRTARRIGVRVIAETETVAIVDGLASGTQIVRDGDAALTDGERIEQTR